MKRFTQTLITSTALLALSAAPSFANHHEGDPAHDAAKKGEKVMTMDKSEMKDEAMKEGKDAIMHEGEMAKEKMMDASQVDETVGEVLQSDGQTSEQMEEVVLEYDGEVSTKDDMMAADDDGMIKDNAIVVPTVGGAEVLTTVACPAGSTAQPDGTCMLDAGEALDYEASTTVNTSTAVDTGTTTTYTTEGKPYKGTLDPATAFGPNS